MHQLKHLPCCNALHVVGLGEQGDDPPPSPCCYAVCVVGLGEHGDDHGRGEEAKAQGEQQVEDKGEEDERGLATLHGLGGGVGTG